MVNIKVSKNGIYVFRPLQTSYNYVWCMMFYIQGLTIRPFKTHLCWSVSPKGFMKLLIQSILSTQSLLVKEFSLMPTATFLLVVKSKTLPKIFTIISAFFD